MTTSRITDERLMELRDGYAGSLSGSARNRRDLTGALDELIERRAATIWTTVDERLPPENVQCVVRVGENEYATAWPTYWHGASVDFNCWTFPNDSDAELSDCVTHWMPIPAAPCAETAAPPEHDARTFDSREYEDDGTPPVVHEGMTIAGNGAAELGALMRKQYASRGGVYPDGNPNAALAQPIAYVPVHPRNGPLWSMATDDPSPERLPSYPLMPVYGAPTAPAVAIPPLTEAQILACIVAAGCLGTVKMSFESGPYSIDRPSLNADKFARAVEASVRKQFIGGEG